MIRCDVVFVKRYETEKFMKTKQNKTKKVNFYFNENKKYIPTCDMVYNVKHSTFSIFFQYKEHI